MSTSLLSSTPNFQPILDRALKEYRKRTGKELITHPLSEEITSCDSPEAILAVLQGKADELNQSQSSDERLTKWLTPTVNVLNSLSATLGEGVGTVFPPTKMIFSGISIFLVAARDTAASRDALIELFDRIEDFFVRLRTYTEVPPTTEMTNAMGKILAETLSMLAIATKEMKQRPIKTFLKRVVGRNDIGDALRRLDMLEQGELRTVTAQMLKTTSDLKHDAKETKVMVQKIVSDINSRDWVRLLRDLRGWLTPPDPSTNHNIACDAQHERTSAWIFNQGIFKEWGSSSSLLWIHGKPGSGKSVLCSAIIQHIITLRDVGLAIVVYFYFDFRDANKKYRRGLLSSLLVQLASRSTPCLNILSHVYSAYDSGKEQPSERVLVQCLKDMLMAPSLSQFPTYIILDALDECPNTSGIPTARGHVLELVKDLVGLCLPNLHMCITSRWENDIRTTLEPLASGHLSLHDQPGQKSDIVEYISAVVQSDPQMISWREDDRSLVIKTLSEKADGMFRWVFCQLEMLRHCLAPSLRRQLYELPKTLDETYERVLKEIESTNQGQFARRLLHCLAVACRPLRVAEFAEVLAFDLDTTEGEIPTLHAEWRWEDQERAVLSACSSLVSIVDGEDGRVVQFSHFSVKEYLTSSRLVAASGDISRYHILPEPAHLILARACLGVLLNPDNCVDEEYDKSDEGGSNHSDSSIPLLKYAAEHWASHAQVGSVSSRLKDAMTTLFDLNKPYFLAWIRIYDIDPYVYRYLEERHPQPLYYATLCGFYDLVRRLVVKHPEQVNYRDGNLECPLVVALFKKDFRVAELLIEHGAHINVRGRPPLFHTIRFSEDARVDAVQFLLRRGADVNATEEHLWTPLHIAAERGYLKVAQMLLEHGAEVDCRNDKRQTPLHLVSIRKSGDHEGEREGDRAIFARILVECGADVMIQDEDKETPLHFASSYGRTEIARLLLDHGANAQAENTRGQSPLHAVPRGIRQHQVYPYIRIDSEHTAYHRKIAPDVALLLLERGVDVNALDEDHGTPLHYASSFGMLEVARLLIDHGAKANAENVRGETPLHLVSQYEAYTNGHSDVARPLLKLGVDVNARDKYQATPLHFACYRGHFETALVLLDHGAEVNAQNVDGWTPLDRAINSILHNDERVVQLMLDRGAVMNTWGKDWATP